MKRRLLSLTLCFTTLLGPMWCCCALGSILTTMIGGAASGCCCSAADIGDSDEPCQAPTDCPCKKSRSAVVTGDRVEFADADSSLSLGWQCTDLVNPLDEPLVRNESRNPPRRHFLPSGVDLLYTLCDMRC